MSDLPSVPDHAQSPIEPVTPVDPADVVTHDDLRIAVFAMIPHTQDRAVQNKTGLGKTSVNEIRRGLRRFSRDALDKIVTAYDPDRRLEWLAAWQRAQADDQAAAQREAPREPADLVLAPDPAHPPREALGEAEPGVVVHPSNAPPTAASPLEVTAPGGRGWFTRRRCYIAAVLATVIVVAVALSFFQSSKVSIPVTVGATPLGGTGCPSPGLDTEAPVVAEAGMKPAGVSIVAMAYTLTPGASPQIEIGGGLSGPVPAGHHLYVMSRADPGTTDSTPQNNPGNGRFYPTQELRLTAAGCFHVARDVMGHDGSGAAPREYVVLVDDRHAGAEFVRKGLAEGYSAPDLAARGVLSLGYTTVQTSP